MKLSPLLSIIATVGLSASAMGQTVLAEYRFSGSGTTLYTASNVDSSVTATSISRGNNTMVAATANAGNLYYLLRHSTGGTGGSLGSIPESQADALSGNMYISLTLGAVDEPVKLGALTFDFGNHGTAFLMDAYAFATVTIGGVTTVYTSSVYDTLTEATLPYYVGRSPAGTTDTFGRATIDFDGLEVDASAEIRLYTWVDQLRHRDGGDELPPASPGTAYSLRVDNMVFTAQAIPEPGTVVLTLAGILGVAALRRKW